MPVVEVRYDSLLTAEVIWASLIDVAAYPAYLTNVKMVEILSEERDRRVSRWTVLMKGAEMVWTEDELLDHENRVLSFEQTEGDLSMYRGKYKLSTTDSGTLVEMRVEFDVGIAEMEGMLDTIAAQAIESSLRGTIDYVERRVASNAAKNRR